MVCICLDGTEIEVLELEKVLGNLLNGLVGYLIAVGQTQETQILGIMGQQ